VPPNVAEIEAGGAAIELTETPFFPQERYQCGPAALATAISSSGVAVDLRELVDRVYLPDRQGSLQVEMLAATRSAGRIPYVIDGTLQVLWNELAAGRPIVVLQNLGRKEVVLRSGIEQRRVTSLATFLRTWGRGDYWGFVVLRPEELPTAVDRQRYLSAVAVLEKAGRNAEAMVAWNTALEKWPGNPVALFGLGNIALTAGNNLEAEEYFRMLLRGDAKSVVARNNLAIALARQARYEEAAREISIALENTDEPALAKELLDTKALIAEMSRSSPLLQ
jgi:hypothetical protein